MRVSNLTFSLCLTLGLIAAACAPDAPAASPPPAAAGPATPAATAAPATTAAPAAPATGATPAATAPAPAAFVFDSLTMEQKVAHMKSVVQPDMGKIFQEYDGKRYGDFGCATCHGPKKQDPHMALPPLQLSGDGFQKLMAAKPAVMKFMTEKVAPAMAASMRQKPFDPATHTGFGCGGCHKVQ